MKWEAVKSLTFTISVAMVSLLYEFKSAPLRLLGRYSLYFYLIHAFIYRLVGNGFKGSSTMIILPLCLILTLFVGFAVGLIVEWFMKWMDLRITGLILKND